MRIIIKVKPQEDRLDKFLLGEIKDQTRSQIQKLIEHENILINAHRVTSGYKLKKGDVVDINLPLPEASEIKAENIPLKIVYEDSDVVVIEKPAGLVVHPTVGHTTGTLVNALLYHWKSLPGAGESLRPGIVHRLDKDTSGLMVVAKTEASFESLKGQFKERDVAKKYLALVSGHLSPKEGIIKANIVRHPKNPLKFAVGREGKEAETKYRVVQEFERYSFVELWPKTGRTHQLRVHLAAIDHPIVGDSLYGGERLLKRQFLHAASLEFTQPTSAEKLSFETDLPSDLQALLVRLT